jgi:hypothetical protein
VIIFTFILASHETSVCAAAAAAPSSRSRRRTRTTPGCTGCLHPTASVVVKYGDHRKQALLLFTPPLAASIRAGVESEVLIRKPYY